MKHIVSFSGGKDSTALLLRMLELKMPIDKVVFADTQKEFPETYEFIDKVEKRVGIKIERIRAEKTWEDWFYGRYTRGFRKGEIRGFPKCHIVDWCSRSLKQVPLHKIEKGNTVYLGIAYDEKHRVQKVIDRRIVKYPLIDWKWTEKDCLEYCKKNDLINPLYSKFKRLGCWCCPKQSKESLKVLKKEYPELWNKLLKMERDSPLMFKPNFKLSEVKEK